MNYSQRLDCDLLGEVVSYCKAGRCRLVDYGAGEGLLVGELRDRLWASDQRRGTDLLNHFRGISVSATDYRRIQLFERW